MPETQKATYISLKGAHYSFIWLEHNLTYPLLMDIQVILSHGSFPTCVCSQKQQAGAKNTRRERWPWEGGAGGTLFLHSQGRRGPPANSLAHRCFNFNFSN